ncbi:MAG: hypothetical protein K6F69_03080 [Treponema sp.]|nr:hypothetical protein [Treponema sp.]
MSIQQLYEKVTDKWIVKAVCLGIAFLMYIFHQAAILEKKSYVIPLELLDDGNVMATSVRNQSVQVMLRARVSDIPKIDASYKSIEAYLDLTRFSVSGTEQVPVYLTLPPDILLLDPLEVRVVPENVDVILEEKAHKYVPVKPIFVGEVAYGYEENLVSVVPNSVYISGPKSIIDGITEIETEGIDISNKDESFSKNITLVNTNKLVTLKAPSSLSVYVGLEPVRKVVSFTNIPIMIVGLKSNLRIANNIPQTVASVDIAGDVLVLDSLNSSRIQARLDFSRIDSAGEYDIPVNIFIPTNARLADKERKTIHVVIENIPVKPVTTESSELSDKEEAEENTKEG